MTSWKSPSDGSWTTPDEWDTGQVPGPADAVAISVAGNYRVSLTAASTVASLTIGVPGAALVIVDPGGTNSFSGDVTNAGVLGVDSDSFTSEGGSTVTIGGTLTNTGSVVVGPGTGSLSSASSLTVGALAGTGGVALHGSGGATPSRAALDVLSAAPGTLSGSVSLDGDALLEYASGQIGTIAGGVQLAISGPIAFVADASTPAANSALTGLTEIDGTLRVVNGASVGIAGNPLNAGFLDLDGDSFTTEGGSTITVAGTLTNTGSIVIGPATGGLSSAALLTVGALAGTGGIAVHGAGAVLAELDVLSAAPGTLAANVTLDGDSRLLYASGQVGKIASGIQLSLSGPVAFVADASTPAANSALTGLTEIDGTLRVVNGASVAIAGDLLNAGFLDLDGDSFTTEGGSTITVAGTLTNTGSIVIGPATGGLSSAALLTVGALAGTGGVAVHGAGAVLAELDVLSAAPGTLAANVTLDGDSRLLYASGQVGKIASGIQLSLSGPVAFVADASTPAANSALTGLTEIDGTLRVVNGASVAIAGDLLNAGFLDLDGDSFTTEGGSTITVAGTLTNTGSIVIGPATGGLSSAALLTVGALAGTGGIAVHGAGAVLAELDVLSAAPGTLAANVTLDGDSRLLYASGQVGKIASGIQLSLSGPVAFVADASTPAANSALTGLTEIDGTLRVVNGASVAIAGDLLNAGFLDLDGDSFTTEGGSTITVAGTLTNTGSIVIGPATGGLSSAALLTVGALAGTGGIAVHGAGAVLAELNVLSAAPGTLAANVTLDGDSRLLYASGQVGKIAAGVTLSLSGGAARVADAADTTTNSALVGLTETDGTLRVIDGNSVTVTGNLLNAGNIILDGDGFTTEGGSTITVAGTLTSTGSIVIGPATGGLSSAALLTVGALAGTGGVAVHGAGAVLAELDVLSAAPGTLAANVTLDGDSRLLYASGEIGKIASGIQLSLSGPVAFVADASTPAANSALTGLTEIDGTLRVVNGASVAIAGDLLNAGFLDLDGDSFTTEGGSTITVAGTLTNTGSIVIGPATGGLSSAALLTVGALAGTGGIAVHGAGAVLAELNVLSAAPGTLAANVTLDGDSRLLYASGQVGKIAAGVTLSLSGGAARVADAANTTTNSALVGLTETDGTLRVIDGNSVTVTGNLLNAGNIILDGDGFTTEGGSAITIVGSLTNTGAVTIGPDTGGLSSTDTLTVDTLANSGAMSLFGGSPAAQATEIVLISATNTGSLSIGANALMSLASGATFTQSAGTTNLQGTISGQGIDIAGGMLELNGGTVSGDQVTFTGGGTLAFTTATTASPHIGGFVSTDTLEFLGLTATGIATSFAGGLTTATVTFNNASARTVTFAGDYTNAGLAIQQSAGNSFITTSNTASNPAIASIEKLRGDGSLTPNGAPNTLVLDLGVTTLNGPALSASLGVLNAAAAPSDLLDGSFAISGPPVFANAGFGPFNSLASGNADTVPVVTLNSTALGQFTETIVLDPAEATVGGVITPLPNETLIVTGQVLASLPGGGGTVGSGGTSSGGIGDSNGSVGSSTIGKGPTAIGWGDVHMVDFDGLTYNFQAAGEFVLAQSTVPGDSFQVQGRMSPFSSSSVSVLTMIGAEIGADRVSFAPSRAVLVNGVAASLSGAGSTETLSGGTLEEASPGVYVLTWNSGESMTVSDGGDLLSTSISLSTSAAPGSVQGLFGGDSGQAKDFALANGVALPRLLTTEQLYGEFADAWRVSQTTSLLDYGPGQTTATFTDVNFPFDVIALANLPAAVVQNAAAATGAAGITNATFAQQAQLDYAATGDPNLLASAAFAQSTGVLPTAATVAPPPSVPVTLGVQATQSAVTETQGGGPTAATFSIYLTGTAAHDIVVDWAVTSPGAGYLGPTAFGGTLPSGSAVIAQGQTSTTVTVPVPASAFGTEPSDGVQLTITPADGTALFAPTAQELLVNPNPEPGPAAGIALSAIANGATFAQNGSHYTLNLGTFEQGSGPVVAGLGITNTGSAGSDQLAGSFSTSGPAAFTLTGFHDFGPIQSQVTDPEPAISLSTASAGTFTETITVNPKDVNNTGYSAALPTQTITVTGTVASLPPPVISAPATLTNFQDIAAQFPGLSISDLNAPNQPMTVSLVATAGTFDTTAPGALSIQGSGTKSMTLTGSESGLNAALAALALTSVTLGSASVTMAVTDAERATASKTIAVTTDIVPVSNAIFNLPAKELVVPGQYSGLGGLSITDPFAQATNEQLTLQLTAEGADTLEVSGSGGAVVTGQGTGTVSITGTVDQINDYLSDGGELLEYLNVLGGLGIFSSQVNGILKSKSGEDLVISAAGGTEGKFFQVGVEDASFALNQLIGAIPGNTPPSEAEHIQRLIKILTGATVLSGDGTTYAFNPAGEFVFATSTQASDSLDVQVRFQQLGGSGSASVMTQLGAQVGTDSVTFGVGRANTVWVDDAPITLTLGNPHSLSGGEVTQASANVYQVSWNTGEVLTITAQDEYLDASLNPGPNDVAGDIVGLGTDSTTAGNEFTLPDGSVLTQPFPEADLYSVFAAAWAVPQKFSILNYGPGQTTATFTNTSFPTSDLTLANLPASIVAMAATIVANAGITDPNVARIAEFDYLASGGDMNFVTDDANQFQGLSISPAQITPVSPAPVAIGVIADKSKVLTASSAPIAVVFDLYLTVAAAADTKVDYTVAGTLGQTIAGGSATIAAGKTTGQFTVNLPAGSLGSLPSQVLQVDISSPGGTPLFTNSAQTTIDQTIPGPPPVPDITDLTNLGTFTDLGHGNYTLDLGQIQYGEQLPDITFSIANDADAPADTLTGALTATSVEGFNVTGTTLPSGLDPGRSYQGLDVSLNFVKFGENTEVITFTPQDTNNTGFSAPLPAETLTITDDIVPPTMVFSAAWGDVHITTYNGLLYNFQAVGEFTLAHSRVPGNSFDIQLRLVPLQSSFGTISTIQEVGVAVGADRITFDGTRPDAVWIDGVPSSISSSSPVISLAGGSLTQLTLSSWKVQWNTGEEATIIGGGILNVYDGIPLSEPDQVGGLQGEDAGQANDFQLSDGTVLQQPLTYAQLYGPYADSWRVSQQSSLLDYGPGQTTATFTNRNYPADLFDPATVPAAQMQKAAAAVAADGITDPGLVKAAELDYLTTNNPSIAAGAAPVQQQVASTTIFTPTAQPTPEIGVGVEADVPGVVAKASGVTPVVFDVSQTGTLATGNTVAYTVVDGGTGFLGAAAFGGTLPTGNATIGAGQISSTFTIDIPTGALGTLPSADLEVSISNPGPVFAPMATVAIANNQPEPGTAAAAVFTDLTTPSNLIASTPQTYKLNLGTFAMGQVALPERLSLTNNVMAPADDLTGAFAAPVGSGFVVVGGTLPNALTPTQSYSGMYVTPQTNQPGVHSETIAFTPKDVNASGYSVTQAAVTIVMTETVAAGAEASINSPGLILFPNAHVGTAEQQAVSVSNTANSTGGNLNVTPSAAGFSMASGTIASLAPGGLDATDIKVGLDTSGAGSREGIVTLAASSTSGSAAPVPLNSSPAVTVFGNVYRQAAASIAPVTQIVHVGDPGGVALSVSNTAAADGFSESLIASLAAATGGLGVASAGPTTAIVAGGSDTAALQLGFSTANAGTISGTATVDLTSDGGTGTASIDGLGTSALAPQTVQVHVTVDNFAAPVLEDVSNAGTFSGGGTVYALNLGTVAQGSAPLIANIGVLNNAAGPADLLSGSLIATGSSAFTNGGLAAFGSLAATQADIAPTITLATGTAGAFSETITLSPTGSNTSGFSAAQPAETLTVTGSVTPAAVGPVPAIATVLTPTPIDFGALHAGAVASRSLDIGNTAAPPAAALDGSVQSVAGSATANGSFTGLAAGATDSSVTVGLDTSTAGLAKGSATLAFISDNGAAGSANLANQTIAVAGTIFRDASATIAPISTIVHVGDPGAVALAVSNTATNDGFSENLIASLTAATPGFTLAAPGPSGDIVPGASDTAALALGFSTAQAAALSGMATVGLTSDGGTGAGAIDGLGTTALAPLSVPLAVTVDNFANPVFEDVSNIGTFSGSGTAYALNLGTIAQGSAPLTVNLGVRNSTTGPSDLLSGSLQASGSSAFTNSGLASFGSLAAGAANLAPSVTLATATAGTFSETITLSPTGSNAGGFSAALAAETLTVSGTIASTGTISEPPPSQAVAGIVTANPFDFGAVHLGATAQQALDISNTAPAGSAALDASVRSTTGAATAAGSFSGLAGGGSDTTGINVGLATSTAGVQTGTVTLGFVSDAGVLGTTDLASQNVTVSGTVYRQAMASLLPLNEIVHVGDAGTIALPVSNADPDDGFSENLTAMLIGTDGGLGIAAAGPATDIAAGQTNATALALSFSTAQAGTVSGSATVGLTSDGGMGDGGTGVGSIDGLGTTALAVQAVPVSIVVDNFAAPVLNSDGALTATGADSYVLNLGTATLGAAALSGGLTVGNGAAGPADWLDGTWSASGGGFNNSGLAAFSQLAAGASLSAGQVSLSTGQLGSFSETILLSPTDANAGGFSAPLAQRSITVTGSIVAPTGSAPIGTALGDVHMVTFDGLRYDFQATGAFVLARSAVPGDRFQIQIETSASPTIAAVSITTEAAAQVGSDVVTFGINNVLWLDGAPDTALSTADPVQRLAGGVLEELSPGAYRLTWSGGEALNVTDAGPYLNDSVSLPAEDGAGSVQGLLGSDSGQANDFQLADGTVLQRPLSESELLGTFANAWRVSADNSLFGNAPMQFLGADGQSVMAATAAGQTLAAGPGVDVLSDAGGFGVTFQGSLAELADAAIAGFTAKDLIDVTDLGGAAATLGYDGSVGAGMLQVSDGSRTGTIQLTGQIPGGWHVTSDAHGGALIGVR